MRDGFPQRSSSMNLRIQLASIVATQTGICRAGTLGNFRWPRKRGENWQVAHMHFCLKCRASIHVVAQAAAAIFATVEG